MLQNKHKMVGTIFLLSSLISSISAVNNFGVEVDLGPPKPEVKRMVVHVDGTRLQNRMTNSENHSPTQTKADSGSRSGGGTLYNGDTDSDGAFFANGLKPDSAGVTGDEFVQIQSRTQKSLKPFESLMTLDLEDDCDTSVTSKADSIIQYFGNLEEVKPSELDEYLSKAEEITLQSKPMCDFRRFLRCDLTSKKCNHYADGVVNVEKSGSKTVYKIGGGGWCFNYPKIFDSTVEVRCAENTHGTCARANPGICTCKTPAGGLLCDQNEVVQPPRQTEQEKQPELSKQPELLEKPELVDPGSPVLLPNQKAVLADGINDETSTSKEILGTRLINAVCHPYPDDDCDISKQLTCQRDPSVALKQPIDREDGGEGEGEVPSLEADISSVPYFCQCQDGYAPAELVYKPCNFPEDCASGFCTSDGAGTKTCRAKLNGLLFVDSIYGRPAGAGISLGPAWIINLISFLSVFTLTANLSPQ